MYSSKSKRSSSLSFNKTTTRRISACATKEVVWSAWIHRSGSKFKHKNLKIQFIVVINANEKRSLRIREHHLWTQERFTRLWRLLSHLQCLLWSTKEARLRFQFSIKYHRRGRFSSIRVQIINNSLVDQFFSMILKWLINLKSSFSASSKSQLMIWLRKDTKSWKLLSSQDLVYLNSDHHRWICSRCQSAVSFAFKEQDLILSSLNWILVWQKQYYSENL